MQRWLAARNVGPLYICPGKSVGERLQRIVQQPPEGGVCRLGTVRHAAGGEDFGSGIQEVLGSGAVAQRDGVQDADGIRRRTWFGLRYAPSALSSITTPTDSQESERMLNDSLRTRVRES